MRKLHPKLEQSLTKRQKSGENHVSNGERKRSLEAFSQLQSLGPVDRPCIRSSNAESLRPRFFEDRFSLRTEIK
jgi:hypothetical protein